MTKETKPANYAASEDGSPPGNSEKRDKVQTFKISLKEADDYIKNTHDVFIEKLNKLKLLDDRFVYHAFLPSRLTLTIENGTPHRQEKPRANEIFCMSSDDVRNLHLEMKLLDYVQLRAEKDDSDHGIFAIYDKNQLAPYIDSEEDEPEHYVFKDPQNKQAALVAIVRVDHPWGAD